MATSVVTPAAAPPPAAPAAPAGSDVNSMRSAFAAALGGANPPASADPGAPGGVSPETPATPAVPATPATPAAEAVSLEDFDFSANADPATPTPETPQAPEGGEPTEGEGEQPAGEPKPDPADQVRELLAKSEPWTKEEEDRIRGAFLATNGGRKMLEARRVLDGLEAPPEEGGLGYRPSREEIVQGVQDSLAMLQVFHDFDTNPGNWMANFFGYRDAQGQLVQRPNAPEILQAIPEHLLRIDPQGQLHSQVARSFLSPYLDRLRSSIMELPNQTKEQTDAKLRRIQGLHDLEFQLTGDIQRIPGVDYGDGPYDPAKPDPAAAAKAQLAEEQRRFNEQQQQAARQAYENAYTGIESAIESECRASATAILKAGKLDQVYPALFPDLVEKFLSQVFEATSGNAQQGKNPRNPRGFQTYRIQAERAARGQMDRNLPVRTYSQLAQDTMRKLVSPFLQQHISKDQAANGALHARAQAAQQRTEPAPGGAPAGAPAAAATSAANMVRKPDQSPVDFGRDLIRQALSGGAAAAAIRR